MRNRGLTLAGTGIYLVAHRVAACLLLAVAVSWASPPAKASPEYEVVPSPYPILDSDFLVNNRNGLFWLDEDRVLFVGSRNKKPVTREDPPIGGFGIYIWDTRSNSVKMYRKKIHGKLCYEAGWIHYTVKLTDPLRFASGPMGQERVTTLVTEGDKKQFFANHFYSRTTCRFYDRATYDNTLRDGMYVVPLKEHGKLLRVEIRSRGEVGRSFFFDSWDTKGRQLPFNFHDFVVSRVKFYAFSQRYFITPRFADRVRRDEWADNDCAPAWWLAADGATEAFCLPAGPWYAPASILLEPLRDGMAVVSHRVFDDRPSPGGLYFVDDTGHVKLADGWVHSPATSPSGCRLAFTHAPDHWAAAYGRGRGKTTLKMIDFCIENR